MQEPRSVQASRHRFHKGNESFRRDEAIQGTQTNERRGNARKLKKGPCRAPTYRNQAEAGNLRRGQKEETRKDKMNQEPCVWEAKSSPELIISAEFFAGLQKQDLKECAVCSHKTAACELGESSSGELWGWEAVGNAFSIHGW